MTVEQAYTIDDGVDTRREFEALAREFGLKPMDFYFLKLIPLIEMIWADGHNQAKELALLYKFTIEHIAALDLSAGVPFAAAADANDFLDRFAHRRPPPLLLEKLRGLAIRTNAGEAGGSGNTILDYCLDIAAACTVKYPYGPRERIVDREKQLLTKLFAAYNGAADAGIK